MTRRAVFLDRDGTVLIERDYLADPEGVEFVPGAPEAVRALRSAGFAVVVATNQSGIARGYYTLEDYRAVERRVERLLAEAGAPLDATYFCPHHPDFDGACACRKPATGLYRSAAAELDLDLQASYYVGDRAKDVLPALELGGVGILVRTGYGEEEASALPSGVEVVRDLGQAARRILEAP